MTDETNPLKKVPETRVGAFNKNKERFAVFLKNTDQKEVQLRATLAGLKRIQPKLWEALLNPNADFRVFAVGAGNGGLEIPLMKSLIEVRGTKENLSLSCEDVSSTMRDEFLENIAVTDLTQVAREYQIVSFDDPSYSPPIADFVISSHVWYYIQNWKNTPEDSNSLEKFRNVITKDGVGLITLYSEKSDRYALLKHMHALTKQGEPESAGEEVVAELGRLNIGNQAEIVEAHTNVSCCFENGLFSLSEEGKKLLSFILRTDWDILADKVK